MQRRHETVVRCSGRQVQVQRRIRPARLGQQGPQAVQALAVIAFRPARTAIDVLEQAQDTVEQLALLRRFHRHQAAPAAPVAGADIDHQAVAAVGIPKVQQQRLGAAQAERQGQLEARGGRLSIAWAGEGQPVYLSGPAETVFEGEITL